MLSIVYGILAALVWGACDFAGGISSRRAGALITVFVAEIVGMGLLVAAQLMVREAVPSTAVLLSGFTAGALGSFAMLLLYRALEVGLMSIAAPVSALMAAILPILIGAFADGLPGWLQILGFVFALLAVWLMSQQGENHLMFSRFSDLKLPIAAGLTAGLYLVLINQSSHEAIVWPMIASRTGGVLVLLSVLLLRKQKLSAARYSLPLIAAVAILDLSGSLCYILAGQNGRMDIAAVLSALYPAATVFLAWLVLKERIGRSQTIGIVAALAAIVFLTV